MASTPAADFRTGVLPVIHSIFDPEAIAAEVEARYDIGGVAGCVLYRSYANDVFRITALNGDVYYLKVYRRDWRPPSEVAWELRIQRHLMASGVSIASPIDRRDGAAMTLLHAPEGERAAVLYAQASGHKPQRPFTAELYGMFGRAAARLHAALDTVADAAGGEPDDVETLVLTPARLLRQRVDPLPGVHQSVDSIAERLAHELEGRARTLDWGICHGDLTLDNFTITGDGSITFFDFDLAAQSWRARDPCGIYAFSRQVPGARDFWNAFLTGYQTVRPFSEDNVRAVPLMHAVYQFWDLGHEVSRWSSWSGQWRVSPEMMSSGVGDIQRWIEAELD